MKMAKKRHSSLFLIELMIALLFFSLAAVVCVQFFIQSHLLSQKAVNLNEAVLLATSIAEEFRARDGEMESQTIYLDDTWQPTEANLAIFTTTVKVEPAEGTMMQANIIILGLEDAPIYELEVLICP